MASPRRARGSAALLGVGLCCAAGCADGPPWQGAPAAGPPVGTTRPAIGDTKSACSTSFAVAEVQAGRSCSTLAAELGLTAVPAPPALGGGRRIGGKSYCVFSSDHPHDLAPPAADGMLRMVVDCPLLGGSPPPTLPPGTADPQIRTTLRQTRGANLDAASSHRPLEPWTEALPALNLDDVEVAVIDASPFGLERPDLSGHGYAVSHAIASVLCLDDRACADHVRATLTLPMIQADGRAQVSANGGHFGYLYQLGDAIEQAVRAARSRHLVLNLSLGWDARMTADADPDAGYVLQTLRHAACAGAVAIAAAGNLPGGEAAMLPAAWEALPAPGDCREFGLPDPQAERPLVHAVAAVGAEDTFVATTRQRGKPRLAAYGLYATMRDAAGRPVGPISGTSAAAAFVSGIAAATWAAAPDLAPGAVMDALYEGGLELSADAADLCFRGPCQQRPRRLSLCGALTHVGAAPRCTVVPLAAPLAPDLIPQPPQTPSPTPVSPTTAAPAAAPRVAPQDPSTP